jgi:nucleotide-binding universal stress UspA family protein
MGFQRILVALDHSCLSESVFSYALDLAQAYKASLKLFHCLTIEAMGETAMPSVPGEVGHYTGLVDNVYSVQQIGLQGRAEQVQTLLQNYSNMATSQGISTELEQQVGSPGQWLCQVAKDWGADLIVLGRRGRKGLAEAFLGSVSNHVVHHAPCSVLVIQAVQSLEDKVEVSIDPID